MFKKKEKQKAVKAIFTKVGCVNVFLKVSDDLLIANSKAVVCPLEKEYLELSISFWNYFFSQIKYISVNMETLIQYLVVSLGN